MKSIRPYFIVFSAWTIILLLYYLSGIIVKEAETADLLNPVFKLIVLSASLVILFIMLNRPGRLLNRGKSAGLVHLALFLILAGVFTAANFWEAAHGIFDFEDDRSRPIISLLAITISSIHEEVFYRGAVQTYINDKKGKGNFLISKGNFTATVLMTVAHLGFFSVMPFEFALAAFFKVTLFSLIAGYFRDSLNHIAYPILLHVMMNGTHFFIQSHA